jgi:probable addiction module antidote protein
MGSSACHHQAEVKALRKDPELAKAYLQEAMRWMHRPDGRAASLIALRTLAQAYGGMTRLAKQTGVERQSLYRALSPEGNPTLNTLIAVMQAVGMRLSAEPINELTEDNN